MRQDRLRSKKQRSVTENESTKPLNKLTTRTRTLKWQKLNVSFLSSHIFGWSTLGKLVDVVLHGVGLFQCIA